MAELVRDRQTAQGTTRQAVGVTAGPTELAVGARSEVTPASGVGKGERYGKATVGPGGPAIELGSMKTNAAGTTRGATASIRPDAGGPTVEVGLLAQSKRGSSVRPTASFGRQVETADPVRQEDGTYVVSYVVADTSSAGIGVEGKGMRAGPGIGGAISTSNTNAITGTRRFKSREEADDFRRNAKLMISLDAAAGVPTSAEAALGIPVGESRGSTDSSARATSVSGSMVGASIGRNKQESSSKGFVVYRASETLVNVTRNVGKGNLDEWGLSSLPLSNAKGTSRTESASLTLQFDLSTDAGKSAYDAYLMTAVPPTGGGWKQVAKTDAAAQVAYDRMNVLGLGTSSRSSKHQESETQGEGGWRREMLGGQEHEQDPTWLARLTGDTDLFSSSELAYQAGDGEASYTARVRVDSESGEYNQEVFGEHFGGAQGGKDVKASGAWTISAQVSPTKMSQLADERSSSIAPYRDDARFMTKLAAERGAGLVSSVMRTGASRSDWDVELKGDDNFPGRRGRLLLDSQLRALSDRLEADSADADAVAEQARKVLDDLGKRRAAVADPALYRDLPDELRKQQLDLIDDHSFRYNALRQRAIRSLMKAGPGDDVDDAQAQANARRAAAKLQGDERELAILQVDVQKKEGRRRRLRREIKEQSKALGDVLREDGNVHFNPDAPHRIITRRQMAAMEHYRSAVQLQNQQLLLDPVLLFLREGWVAQRKRDPKAALAALRAYDKVFAKQLELQGRMIEAIRDAARAVYPIANPIATSHNRAFWRSLGISEKEAERAIRPVSMSLSD